MLGNAAMSVEIENNPEIVSKEETFVKCTSKKKTHKNDDDVSAFGNAGSVSDTELVTNLSKAETCEKGTKRSRDDSVKPSPNKSVGFLSDTNANSRMDIVTNSARSMVQKAASNEARKQSNKKRHHSVSQVHYGHGNYKPAGFTKRRRKTVDRTPEVKFLMGGTITDPLNLNSLADAEISKLYNAVTPMSSPLPHLNKDPDPVIVPADITDPLKLNTGDDEGDTNLTRTLNRSVKKKRKGSKKEDGGEVISPTSEIPEPGFKSNPPSLPGIEPAHLLSLKLSSYNPKVIDKIVSPVLPDPVSSKFRKRKLKQEPSSKISRALLIESDEEETVPSNSLDSARKLNRTASPEKRKYKRQHSKESQKVPNFNEQNKKFQYGNYNRYYGYRNPDKDDPRLAFLKKEWFADKTCLDIGCNTGHVTLHIAKEYLPQKIVGIDIDGNLIGVARKNIKHCLMDKAKESGGDTGGNKFPVSMEKSFGPISKALMPAAKSGIVFPANVLFRCANFVLSSDALLQSQKPEYDVVLCLSVTKWIHLNWGDAGIKRFFRRIFLALKPGGYFILEPQAWPSYKKKRKLTETVFKNFQEIQFMPDQFKRYLLSTEVGFSSCETIGVPLNSSKGFRRPMLMFTKLDPEKIHRHRTSRYHRVSESSSHQHRQNEESSSHHHASDSSGHHHHHHHHHRHHHSSEHSEHHESDSSSRHHHHHHTTDSSSRHRHHSSESRSGKYDGDSDSRGHLKCEGDSVAVMEGQEESCGDVNRLADPQDQMASETEKGNADYKVEQKEAPKVDGKIRLEKSDLQTGACDKQGKESNKEQESTDSTKSQKDTEREVRIQSTEIKSKEVRAKVDTDKGKSPTKVPDDQDQELVMKEPELTEADSSQTCKRSVSDNKQLDLDTRTPVVDLQSTEEDSKPAMQESTSLGMQESVSSSSSPSSRVSHDSKSTDKQCTRYKKLSVTDSPDRTG
ncbi:7SK snRNA methylphosphate capping enzyme-like [Amphiura filiformis]|uniref:7SK snRNA methylphosphate capping enzyme-like n=1 Tax=Amphiura filiformis TaxID=82378 RepID=UPI003B2168ED